jgi:hypothetical protein
LISPAEPARRKGSKPSVARTKRRKRPLSADGGSQESPGGQEPVSKWRETVASFSHKDDLDPAEREDRLRPRPCPGLSRKPPPLPRSGAPTTDAVAPLSGGGSTHTPGKYAPPRRLARLCRHVLRAWSCAVGGRLRRPHLVLGSVSPRPPARPTHRDDGRREIAWRRSVTTSAVGAIAGCCRSASSALSAVGTDAHRRRVYRRATEHGGTFPPPHVQGRTRPEVGCRWHPRVTCGLCPFARATLLAAGHRHHPTNPPPDGVPRSNVGLQAIDSWAITGIRRPGRGPASIPRVSAETAQARALSA